MPFGRIIKRGQVRAPDYSNSLIREIRRHFRVLNNQSGWTLPSMMTELAVGAISTLAFLSINASVRGKQVEAQARADLIMIGTRLENSIRNNCTPTLFGQTIRTEDPNDTTSIDTVNISTFDNDGNVIAVNQTLERFSGVDTRDKYLVYSDIYIESTDTTLGVPPATRFTTGNLVLQATTRDRNGEPKPNGARIDYTIPLVMTLAADNSVLACSHPKNYTGVKCLETNVAENCDLNTFQAVNSIAYCILTVLPFLANFSEICGPNFNNDTLQNLDDRGQLTGGGTTGPLANVVVQSTQTLSGFTSDQTTSTASNTTIAPVTTALGI